MEPAGLAVGVAGLAGLFSSCLEALERIDSWKTSAIDSRALGSRFEAEKLRLKKWGEFVGFERGTLSQDHLEALDDVQIASRVHEHLSIIQEICSNAYDISLLLTGTDAAYAWHGLFPRSNTQPPSGTLYRLETRRVKWALRNKAKCQAQVDSLGQLVQDIHSLVPPDGARATRAAHGTAGSDAPGNTCDAPAEKETWTAESRGIMVGMKRHIEAETRKTLREWLLGRYVPTTLYDDATQRSLGGAYDWILRRPMFLDWASADFPSGSAKLLWINGLAGFGKTVLCARVAKYLSSTLDPPTAYPYFSPDSENCRDAFVAVRSWLSQLMCQPAAFKLVHKGWETQHSQVATRAEVIRIFREVILAVPGCTFIMDGLDESTSAGDNWTVNDNCPMVQFLETIQRTVAGTNTRIMVACRDNPDVRQSIVRNAGVECLEYKVAPEDFQLDAVSYSRNTIDRRLSDEENSMHNAVIDANNGARDPTEVSNSTVSGLSGHQGPSALTGLTMASVSPRDMGAVQSIRTLSTKPSESAISITAPNRFQCGDPTCACTCHLGRYLKTPPILRRFIGALMFRGTCNNHTSNLWELRYWIPHWVSNYNVYFLFERTAHGSPSFGLKFPRKVLWGGEDTIIRFSFVGDTNGIRSILDSRKCSLDDVDPNHGRTALHYAVLQNHYSACKLLLGSGADQFVEDESGTSATQVAWDHILTKRGSKETLDRLQTLFPIEDLEYLGFSSLHKAVLGLEGLRISELMGLEPDVLDINAQDTFYKRSPLHWAALRGDLKAVELLLELGADVHATDGLHCTPLIYAVSSGTARMVELLILRGAKVNVANNKGETPLHYAARHIDDLETVKTIVRAGARVDQKNSLGNTSFAWAAIMNRVAMGKYLLQCGADRQSTNENGDTPFRETIHQNCHDFLQMLLDCGTRYTDINTSGSSMLHVLALEGDTKTVNILRATELRDLDTQLRNNRGERPGDVCLKRVNAPEGFKDAFTELVSGLEVDESCEN